MSRTNVTNLRSQLTADEDSKRSVYNDHLGFATIGVGRLIDGRKGGGLSQAEINFLLDNDIARVSTALVSKLPWFSKLSSARQGVLQNMAFQMGVDGLLKFKNTLAMIEAGKYDEASKGMLNSLWAKQTPERANRLAKQMRTDLWQ